MKKSFLLLFVMLSAHIVCTAQENDVILPDKPKNTKYIDYSQQEKGVWFGFDLGVGPTLHTEDNYKSSVTLDFNALVGYRYNCYIQAGVGLGVRAYVVSQDRIDVHNSGNKVSIPLFADLRGVMINPNSREVVPCWSFDIGYSFFDGFRLSPTIGIRVGGKERHHFLVGVAYVLQGAETISVDSNTCPGYLHSLQLKLGYQF